MARILVIGGRGFFGGRIAAALRSGGAADVVAAGRDVVNLRDPATFARLRDFDVIVNASDPLTAPPDAAVDQVLREGGLWIETTGETATIERLLALRARRDAQGENGKKAGGNGVVKGVVIVGMGIFPGVSNLLARAVVDEARRTTGRCDRVDVGIMVSPLSGAGRGMCGQMADIMGTDSFWYEGGVRKTGRPIARGRTLPFPRGERAALRIGLPESAMLRASTGLPNVATFVAPNPRAMGPMFLALAWMIPSWRWARRVAATLLRWLFVVQRAVLLRRVTAHSELVAVAGGARRAVAVADGVTAGGVAVAAAVAALAECGARGQRPAPGVYLPDELFTADDILARMGAGSHGATSGDD